MENRKVYIFSTTVNKHVNDPIIIQVLYRLLLSVSYNVLCFFKLSYKKHSWKCTKP